MVRAISAWTRRLLTSFSLINDPYALICCTIPQTLTNLSPCRRPYFTRGHSLIFPFKIGGILKGKIHDKTSKGSDHLTSLHSRPCPSHICRVQTQASRASLCTFRYLTVPQWTLTQLTSLCAVLSLSEPTLFMNFFLHDGKGEDKINCKFRYLSKPPPH
jgi:hypothetical protein